DEAAALAALSLAFPDVGVARAALWARATSRRPWTPGEERVLLETYSDRLTEEVPLLRTPSSVHQRARQLGLCKDREVVVRAGRMSAEHPRAVASRFKPGLTPWNKGTHFRAGGRSAETRFKRGN